MQVVFVLEHGPRVVWSHKLTSERSIFLSIIPKYVRISIQANWAYRGSD